MKLKDWLDTQNVSHGDFAKRIERTTEAVRRYVIGERIPDKSTMPLIVRETAGAVTANDFFDIDAEPDAPPPFVQAGGEKVALCGACDRRAEDPEVSRCTVITCPMREREAA